MCERKTREIFASCNWSSGSIIIWLASCLTNILIAFSPLTWIEYCYFQPRKRESPLWLVEIWIIILLLVLAIALAYGKSSVSWGIAIYGLVDVLGATLRDLVVSLQLHRDSEGGYLLIRNRIRWLLLVPLNVGQIILCFAILLLYYGNQFTPQISDPLTALYQSALTFTTLGYGDFTPFADSAGQIIVSLELAFFLLFLGIKLPIAISVIRIKEQ